MRRKILFVGDGPDVPSGFGRATREILAHLDYRCGGSYEMTVLGINSSGDPGTVPYGVYTCFPGGDVFGIGRLVWMCDLVKPDLIVVQNDGWNIPHYVERLALVKEYKSVPVIAAVAVDGKNFNGAWLKGVSLAVFWTQFALDEARAGGYTGPARVIPLGVDLGVYYPVDKSTARTARKIDSLDGAFIIGNVNRNQSRKRWDLTIKCFAEWVTSKRVSDAWLYLHTAPTNERAVDVPRLARYYGVVHRLGLIEPQMFYGISEDEMRDTYNCFDVCVSTTQGEGMGLPAMEAMACGVPCVLPDWSAYGDWARDAAMLVPCASTEIGPPYQNVIGGVVDEEAFITSLDNLYRRPQDCLRVGDAGRKRVEESRFRWENIGEAWDAAISDVFASMAVAV